MDDKLLLNSFCVRFPGERPYGITRVPGRVNLIGEHTDYNGLPVLPMAISRSIRTAFAPRDDEKVVLYNMNKSFPPREFAIEPEIPPYPTGDWGNYAKAAVWRIVDTTLEKNPRFQFKGLSVIVDGDIPKAAGLSSSSALVVSIGLAFALVNQMPISRKLMAESMAKAERYVGTAGGGMDQAICMLGERDCALKIEFYPELDTELVPMPKDYRVVILNSLVKAPKTERVRLSFNMRAKESGLAAQIISRHVNGGKAQNMGELLAKYGGKPDELLGCAQRILSRTWTPAATAEELGLSLEEFTQEHMRTGGRDELLDVPDSGFALLERFRHVLSEGIRVRQAFRYLRDGDAERFGVLMNQSHVSCAKDYAISCPELDKLVSLALKHGALGARLTGAGFGGCAVALVKKCKVEEFIAALSKEYYGEYLKHHRPGLLDNLENQEVILDTEPNTGADWVVFTADDAVAASGQ